MSSRCFGNADCWINGRGAKTKNHRFNAVSETNGSSRAVALRRTVTAENGSSCAVTCWTSGSMLNQSSHPHKHPKTPSRRQNTRPVRPACAAGLSSSMTFRRFARRGVPSSFAVRPLLRETSCGHPARPPAHDHLPDHSLVPHHFAQPLRADPVALRPESFPGRHPPHAHRLSHGTDAPRCHTVPPACSSINGIHHLHRIVERIQHP